MNLTRTITALVLMFIVGCTLKEASHSPRLQPADTYSQTKDSALEQAAPGPRVAPEQTKTRECKKEMRADRAADKTVCRKPATISASKKHFRSPIHAQRAKSKITQGHSRMMASPPPRACVQPSSAPQMYAEAKTYDTDYSNEQYNTIVENRFLDVTDEPLSTFSIDVDAASYSNVRRFLNSNTLPPVDAVRIEEMINYFTYDYPQPGKKHPFSITAEVGKCPWNADNRLVYIGLQGKKVATDKLPPNNLVFLLDVSGSMNSPNKLPLLKMALKLLVNQLREEDRIAVAVYAGSAGLVLPPTPGSDSRTIIEALDRLQAGGSTAGGAGIQLAYRIAKDNFLKDGNNRVILATDGDFNVGMSSDAELVRLIESKRDNGIYLTVLGFGTGNYKDSKMEQLADKGNGNYAYIDNLLEAKKVLVNEMGGTLLTIAKDVKIQIEFNPENVSAYRLIGYENRRLANRDFNDDTKDAGELGAGTAVTFLYEIIPAGADEALRPTPELKYQDTEVSDEAMQTDELLTIKLRYKQPGGDRSTLTEQVVRKADIVQAMDDTSEAYRFAAAVAGLGQVLRGGKYTGDFGYTEVLALARGARGDDPFGYRGEFLQLTNLASSL